MFLYIRNDALQDCAHDINACAFCNGSKPSACNLSEPKVLAHKINVRGEQRLLGNANNPNSNCGGSYLRQAVTKFTQDWTGAELAFHCPRQALYPQSHCKHCGGTDINMSCYILQTATNPNLEIILNVTRNKHLSGRVPSSDRVG